MRRAIERPIWAVLDLLPATWSRGLRMFLTGMVMGNVIGMPLVIIALVTS